MYNYGKGLAAACMMRAVTLIARCRGPLRQVSGQFLSTACCQSQYTACLLSFLEEPGCLCSCAYRSMIAVISLAPFLEEG
jgi:hypothetical protein